MLRPTLCVFYHANDRLLTIYMYPIIGLTVAVNVVIKMMLFIVIVVNVPLLRNDVSALDVKAQ